MYDDWWSVDITSRSDALVAEQISGVVTMAFAWTASIATIGHGAPQPRIVIREAREVVC